MFFWRRGYEACEVCGNERLRPRYINGHIPACLRCIDIAKTIMIRKLRRKKDALLKSIREEII